MKKNVENKYRGFVKMKSTQEVYQICDVSVNKKELILSILAPTVMQLI